MLRRRAAAEGGRTAFTFLTYRAAEADSACLSYEGLLCRAEAVTAALVARCSAGDRALILCPPGLDYIAAFYGCLLSGVVAVPAYPPRNPRHLERLTAIAEDAGARVVLTVAETGARLASWGHGRLPPPLAVDDLPASGAVPDGQRALSDIAFLQYTSGTTGRPKGVMVSHGNLMANIAATAARCRFDEHDVHVSWLPPYHDLGLIGTVLQPVFFGQSTVIMTPAAFLQDPMRWLRAISGHRGSVSAAPNFAYELCCAGPLPDALDLSSWRCAVSGGEPPRAATMERFAARFAPFGFDAGSFYPGYGLAETTLQVTNGRRQRKPPIRTIATPGGGTTLAVSNGRALDGHDLRIVDPQSCQAMTEGAVGEIWVAGPTVARGYWSCPELTAETFAARLADEPGAGPFLRTGDLGVLIEGELYVLGRRKEAIIIRGRNHSAQDIEATVAAAHPALGQDGTIAFGIEADGTEGLVVVHELGRRALRGLDSPALLAAIRGAVVTAHEIDPHAILLIRPATLPRTSSGKLQRLVARELYRGGRLATVAAWHADTAATPAPAGGALAASLARLPAAQRRPLLQGQLAHWLQQELGLAAAPTPDAGFASLGIDSLAAVRLGGRLSAELRLDPPLPATTLFDQPNLAALAALLEDRLAPAAKLPAVAAPATAADNPIAIVGLAARLPGAVDVDAFWTLLARGADAIRELPGDRFDIDALYDPDPDAPGKCITRHGGFIDAVDAFDADFFGISAREAASLDPQHRLLLELAWEALENAGIAATRLAGGHAGVFLGLSTHDYADLLQGRGLAAIDAHAGTGNAHSAAAGRISHLLGLRGPSMCLDTACSSSLVAVHQACRALRQGECDLALAGGASLILSPAGMVALSKARMLSPDGRCKPFDATADGYGRGEGGGLVVLKPLAAAERDGDRVLAVIRGSAINQDGASAGLTVPNGPAQEQVIAAALAEAGLAPAEVAYLEAHGTGTALGDPVELQAAARALGVGRPAERPLLVGSVKANIGHLEAAAGIAGLIKAVLALERGALPPQPHFRTPNPHLPWSTLPLEVVAVSRPWPAGRRIAGVSAFGFTGTNCHLLLEGSVTPRSRPESPSETSGPQVMALSARSSSALRALAARLAAWTCDHRDATPAELSAAAARRGGLAHRAAIVIEPGEAPATAFEPLAAGMRGPATWLGERRTPPRLGLLFTGQGSQRAGAGRALYRRDPVFRAVLDRCAAVLGDGLDPPLLAVMLAEPGSADAALLDRTRYTQPALFALQAGLLAHWRERGIRPVAALGHSVGEITAAHAAGLLALDEAIALAARRGALMDALPPGGLMAAVFAPADAVAAAIARANEATTGAGVGIAADNGLHQVVSGPAALVERVIAGFAAEGVRCERLTTSHAFHSALMEPALAPLAAAPVPADGRAATLSLVSNLTGAAFPPDAAPDAAYWARQARAPVQFRLGVATLAELGVELLLEIGPRPVLAPLAMGCWPEGRALPAAVPSLRPDLAEDRALAEAVAQLYAAGLDIDPGPPGGSAYRRLALPTYPFQRRRHWLDTATDASVSAGAATAAPLRETIRGSVARALRCDPATLADDRPLQDLGLNSVMAMEVAAALAGRLPVAVGAAAVTGAATIESLHRMIEDGHAGIGGRGLASHARMERDAALEAEIRPPAGAPAPPAGLSCVLLTGAGGFLGAALLARLLSGSAAQVLCLMRPGASLDRLRQALPDDPTIAAAFEARVAIVEGDLLQPRLGLDPAAYDRLAARVDAVLHAAAQVNWLLPYDALAPLNVGGTRELLRLACACRPKPLHLVSTLGVFPGGLADGATLALEGMVPEAAAERFESAYAQTKCVAERLVAEARRRGLPVSVYRMDFLTGPAEGGTMPWRYIVPRTIAAAVELGCLPEIELLVDLLPVDAVGEAIVALASAPAALGGCYHLLNRRPLQLAELRDVLAGFGYPVAMVTYETWLARIAAVPTCGLHPFLDFLRGVAPLLPGYAGLRVDDTQARALLGALAPDLASRLPGPRAICRQLIGDLVRAGRIPPPAWRCRASFTGDGVAAALQRERPAGLRTASLGPDGGVLAAWSRPALGPRGRPLCGEGSAPREVDAVRLEMRGAAYALVRSLAARLAVPPALLLEAAALIAWWRARHSPALVAETVVLARLVDVGPLLGLSTAGFATRQVTLDAGLGFASLVGCLARSADAGAEDAPIGLCVLHRAALDEPVHRSPERQDAGPPVPLLDIACGVRTATLDWSDPCLPDQPAAATLLEMLVPLLADAAARPDTALAALALVEPTTGAGLWARLGEPAGHHPPVLATIAAQAARTPEAVAVRGEAGALTYGALIGRAGAIAAGLAAAGASTGRPVGLCVERTPDLVAALLAIHWVGAAYLPLDPWHPRERRCACLALADAVLVVTDGESDLEGGPATPLRLDRIGTAAPPPMAPGAGAYVIFTSGSTGRPKAVAVGQPALANLVAAMQDRLDLAAHDTLLAVTTIAFDIAALELLLPLTAGASVALAGRETARDGVALAAAIVATGATLLQATPSTWSMLLAADWTGRPTLVALCGGEALAPALAERLLPRVGALWNLYGPTEATIWATAQPVDAMLIEACRERPSLPLGEPLPGLAVAILDDSLTPIPDGVAGELHLAGAGLAEGYLGEAELTAARFPTAGHGPRLYRTGDLVRREDGALHFLGRRDGQIKHRGHRIEPGEIEAHLRAHPDVADAAVVLRDDPGSGPALVAYLATPAPVVPAALRRWLSDRLPSYMVPEIVVSLPLLPRGPTGKLDRRSLPPPVRAGGEAPGWCPPRTETERRLATIWQELLAVDQVGAHDSFFDLHGHSLAAASLFARIARDLGVTLPLRTLADAHTVAELGAAIDATIAGEPVAQDRAARLERLRSDARLPEAIRPRRARPDPDPDAVLLTGATGFLGGHLLAALLARTAARVHCLVRRGSVAEARRRLTGGLAAAGLWRDAWAERLEVLPGDLEADGLGLDGRAADRLSHEVGAIYHCGARVALTEPYRRLRRANVAATLRLLELACAGRPKAFHHVSTLSVFDQPALLDGRRLDEDANPPLLDEHLTGYAASKWVAEQLVLAARAAGLAATVHRPGTIAGDADSGRWPVHDAVPTMVRGCIELGAVPDLDIAMVLTPVGFVADAIVAASRTGETTVAVFHPIAGRAVSLAEMTGWLERLGYRLERLPYESWRGRLRRTLLDGGANALAGLAPLFLESLPEAGGLTAPELLAPGRAPRFGNTAVATLMGAAAMSAAAVDESLFARYVAYWRAIGQLPPR